MTCRTDHTGTVSLQCVGACDRSMCWTERTPARRCHIHMASPRCAVCGEHTHTHTHTEESGTPSETQDVSVQQMWLPMHKNNCISHSWMSQLSMSAATDRWDTQGDGIFCPLLSNWEPLLLQAHITKGQSVPDVYFIVGRSSKLKTTAFTGVRLLLSVVHPAVSNQLTLLSKTLVAVGAIERLLAFNKQQRERERERELSQTRGGHTDKFCFIMFIWTKFTCFIKLHESKW